jgi:hypothetical protein
MFASNEPQKQVINHFVDWQPHSARMKPLWPRLSLGNAT